MKPIKNSTIISEIRGSIAFKYICYLWGEAIDNRYSGSLIIGYLEDISILTKHMSAFEKIHEMIYYIEIGSGFFLESV